jgi:hypothetical protein
VAALWAVPHCSHAGRWGGEGAAWAGLSWAARRRSPHYVCQTLPLSPVPPRSRSRLWTIEPSRYPSFLLAMLRLQPPLPALPHPELRPPPLGRSTPSSACGCWCSAGPRWTRRGPRGEAAAESWRPWAGRGSRATVATPLATPPASRPPPCASSVRPRVWTSAPAARFVYVGLGPRCAQASAGPVLVGRGRSGRLAPPAPQAHTGLQR